MGQRDTVEAGERSETHEGPETARGGPPREPPRVHWRHLLPIFRHPYRGYLRLHRRFGPTVAVARPGGRRPLIFTADEELATAILVDHGDAITRPPNVIRNIFRVTVGDNIVASRGEAWKGKRRRGSKRLRAATLEDSQIAALQGTLRELLDDLRRAVRRDPTLDLLPHVERFTLRAAIRLVSEAEVDPASDDFEALLEAMRFIMHATQRIADLRKQMFLFAALPWTRRVVDRRRYRRLEGAVRRVAAFEPDPEVRELFMAAYENPSTTLTWALALTAAAPEAQRRLGEEAGAVNLISDTRLTVADLEALRYADAAIRETARLRPAIAYLARQARRDLEIDGLHLRDRSHVIIVPYCLHMDPRRWPAPERFDPERFLSDRDGRLWSFGVGPRACVGTRFALQLLAAALAAIAREFRWHPVAGREPSPPSGRFPWSEKIHCWLTLTPR